MEYVVALGEVFQPAINNIEEYVDLIQHKVEETFNSLSEITKKYDYDLLKQAFGSLEKSYNIEVIALVKQAIQNWADGDASIVSIAQKMHASEGAITTARKQQDEIVSKINSIKEFDIISQIQLTGQDVFNPKVKDELSGIMEVSSKLKEANGEYKDSLNKLAEDNNLVNSLVSVGNIYGESISQFIVETIKVIEDFLNEEFDKITKSINEAYSTSNSNSQKTIDESKAFVEEVHKNIKGLYD